MQYGILAITFNPSNIQKDWLLSRFPSMRKYFTHTTYEILGQFDIQQTVHYDSVPSYLLENTKKKLQMSDFQFEMYIYK